MTNKPVHKLRDGAIEVSIWKNEGEKGPRYSVISPDGHVARRVQARHDLTSPSGYATS
jgi:hypothetical protein